MRVEIKNAGPIKQAEVDLSKQLIVLTGPNNSGKTWLSWIVYAMMRSPVTSMVMRPSAPIPFVTEVVQTIAKDLITNHKIPFDFHTLQKQFFSQWATATRDTLDLCFAAPQGTFSSTTIHFTPPTILKVESTSIEIGTNKGPLSIEEKDGHLIMTSSGDKEALLAVNGIEHVVSWSISHVLGSPSLRETHLLPAERMTIPLFMRELLTNRSGALEQIQFMVASPGGVNMVARALNRYPWPILDHLHSYALLSRNSIGPYADLAETLEREALRGSIHVSGDGDLEFHHDGVVIPVQMTSSIVKSLASIVLFLRHQAIKESLLILDEPELNLHPDNQRVVARVLAMAVNRGLRIMLSTHSDWFLRELNRLMLAARLPAEQLLEHELEPAMVLSPEKVGIYLFRNGSSELVPITEVGFSIATIDEATNRLNDAEQKLYQALAEQS